MSLLSPVNDDLFAALTRTGDLQEFLHSLASNAAGHFSTDEYPVAVSISMLRHYKYGTLAASSAFAASADEFQYKIGEGPCMTAA